MRVLAVLFLLVGFVACAGGEQEDAPAAEDLSTPAAETPTPAHTPADGEAPTPTPTVEPTPTAATPTATVPADPLTLAACEGPLPGAVSPGMASVRELEVGGEGRSYRVYLPPTYRPSTALPAVLNFHGLGSSAEEQEALSGLRELAEREGFALVSPEGTGDPRGWRVRGLAAPAADGAAFVDALLHDLASIVCFDPGRVYATGFGHGGFVVSLLACDLPHRFAAVAPVAGVTYPRDGCGQAVPTIAFHGTADEAVPFGGGRMASADMDYEGVRAELAEWARTGNCMADAYPQPVSGQASYEGYGGCDGDASVAVIVIEGLGHEWPTEANAGVSAAERMWEFFSEYEDDTRQGPG